MPLATISDMQGPTLAIVIVLLVAAAALVTVAGVWWLPPLASNWGTIDAMLVITLVITGVAFVAVHLVIAYFVVRYRRERAQQAEFIPDNPKLEKILIGVTSLGIVILLAPGLFVYSRFIQPPSAPLVVEVLGQQWSWSYRLPGADGELGRADPVLFTQNPFGVDVDDPKAQDDVLVFPGSPLHLPVNRAVLLKIRSKDVIHSVYIPAFRVKMDAVPGLLTQTWFIPTKTGTFELLCAELCGIGHFNMKSAIVVESEAEFEDWLRGQTTVSQAFLQAQE